MARIDYYFPPRCPSCESRNLKVGICFKDDSVIFTQVRWVCANCGDSDALRKQNTNKKRLNHRLATWASSVKKRDDYKCVICGSNEDLHAHHLIRFADSEEDRYRIGNGVTLCKSCHERAHKEDSK